MLQFKVYKGDEEVAYFDTKRMVLMRTSDNAPAPLFCHNRFNEVDYRYFIFWLTGRTYQRHRDDVWTLLERDGLSFFDTEIVVAKTGGRKISDNYWIGVESKPC